MPSVASLHINYRTLACKTLRADDIQNTPGLNLPVEVFLFYEIGGQILLFTEWVVYDTL